MKEIIINSLILMFVCVIAAASLSFVYQQTEPIIKKNREQNLEESLKKVLPDISEKPEPINQGVIFEKLKKKLKLEELYKAQRTDGKDVYAAFISVSGYQGPIKLLVGFEPDESIIFGVKILEHSETPGLGARIAEEKEDQETFLDGLEGEIKKKDEYDTITGATISSNAVIDGVISVLRSAK